MRQARDVARRGDLPSPEGPMWLTEGGNETTLIVHDQIEQPMFAAFTMLTSDRGRAQLRRHYARYVARAEAAGCGLIIDTPTWRASSAWGETLGLSRAALARTNRRAASFARDIRDTHRGAIRILDLHLVRGG